MSNFYSFLAKKAVNHVAQNYPYLIQVYLTESDYKTLAFYIEVKRYDTIMYLYGHKFLLAMMEYFIEIEEYEICKEIVDSIEKHNKITKDNLPMTL